MAHSQRRAELQQQLSKQGVWALIQAGAARKEETLLSAAHPNERGVTGVDLSLSIRNTQLQIVRVTAWEVTSTL
jgi:hypothetical protein